MSRFVLLFAGFLALFLPSLAEAGRGIPIIRGTEHYLSFVAQTEIQGSGSKPLVLCHYYETSTLYYIGFWMRSNGYVLSDTDCAGDTYIDDPALIQSSFANGAIPADIPQTPQFSLRQRAEGHAWIGIGVLLVLAYGLKLILGSSIKPRKSKREERMEVLGLPDNAVFRFIDAMLHAANADGRAQPEEVAFIRDKATDIAQLEYTAEHIEWAINHTDKLKTPRDFQRFGQGLSAQQARMVLRAALAVVASDGVMSRSERRFISQLTSGLMLDAKDVNDILNSAESGAEAQPA